MVLGVPILKHFRVCCTHTSLDRMENKLNRFIFREGNSAICFLHLLLKAPLLCQCMVCNFIVRNRCQYRAATSLTLSYKCLTTGEGSHPLSGPCLYIVLFSREAEENVVSLLSETFWQLYGANQYIAMKSEGTTAVYLLFETESCMFSLQSASTDISRNNIKRVIKGMQKTQLDLNR